MRKVIFTYSAMFLLLLVGCSQNNSVPNAVVKQAQSTVQLPKETDIQSLDIASDGAASMLMVPKNPTVTIIQVLKWLSTAEPVSVQLPQSKSKKQWVTNAYTGPSILYLNLKNKENIIVTPAYYVWVTDSGFAYHYLDDVVAYQNGNVKTYFKAPALYKWLKDDQWKSRFKFKTN